MHSHTVYANNADNTDNATHTAFSLCFITHVFDFEQRCMSSRIKILMLASKISKLQCVVMSNMHWHPAETMLFVYEVRGTNVHMGMQLFLYNKKQPTSGVFI